MQAEFGPALEGDVDRICAIVADRLEPEDVGDARLALEGPLHRRDDWMVARLDGQVEAFALAVPLELRVGVAELPALNIEIVATTEKFGGHGLQRSIFDAITRRHSDRTVHLIEGIPYFYRQLGYEYAIRHPQQTVLGSLESPPGWSARRATVDDVELIRALQEGAQAGAAVAFTHTRRQWEWIVSSPVYRTVIVERGGEVAMARGYGSDDTTWVMDVAASSLEATRAAIASAAGGANQVRVYHRPGVPAISGLVGKRAEPRYAYFTRVTDPLMTLSRLRPELDRRLWSSKFADLDGQLLVSFYRSSAMLAIGGGRVTDIQPGPGVPAPVAGGGVGIPPDLLAHLLFGADGAVGLEARHPDVLLGRHTDLAGVLFPPVTADVQTWVAP